MATTRQFPAPHLDLATLISDLQTWFQGQSFNCQTLQTEDGGTLLQIEKQGGWRKFAGMSTALNIVLRRKERDLEVEIGAGKWIDKAAAGAISLFVLWPLAVTAAFGAWEQSNMPGKVFDFISKWVLNHQGAPLAVAVKSGGDTTFYLSIGGRTSGPLTAVQIAQGLRGGDIPPAALVCPVGGQSWMSVDACPDIARMLPPPPPPPPPPPSPPPPMPPLPGDYE
jgi:hypothetical protein